MAPTWAVPGLFFGDLRWKNLNERPEEIYFCLPKVGQQAEVFSPEIVKTEYIGSDFHKLYSKNDNAESYREKSRPECDSIPRLSVCFQNTMIHNMINWIRCIHYRYEVIFQTVFIKIHSIKSIEKLQNRSIVQELV